jgi:hypothetical protein
MRRRVFTLALPLAFVGLIPTAGFAAAQMVKWSDVRGIVQAGSTVGTGTGLVTGGGAPWTTSGGSAAVNLDNGNVRFLVRGLVLASGNSVGTRGGIAQVKGTLVCDTNGSASAGNSILVDTPLVDLDEQGNASFNGNVGTLPGACAEPDIAFLVRTGGGAWIAFGAVRRP